MIRIPDDPTMKIISLIHALEVIERILRHLGLGNRLFPTSPPLTRHTVTIFLIVFQKLERHSS